MTFTLEQKSLYVLGERISAASNPAKLKRSFGAGLKEAIAPALPVIQAEVMAMGGGIVSEPPLRAAVAGALKTNVRYTGDAPGVRVFIGRTGMPRGFTMAARRINRGEWTHPVYNRPNSDVIQRGKRGFFDDPLQARRDELRKAIERALENIGEEIARGQHGI